MFCIDVDAVMDVIGLWITLEFQMRGVSVGLGLMSYTLLWDAKRLWL